MLGLLLLSKITDPWSISDGPGQPLGLAHHGGTGRACWQYGRDVADDPSQRDPAPRTRKTR